MDLLTETTMLHACVRQGDGPTHSWEHQNTSPSHTERLKPHSALLDSLLLTIRKASRNNDPNHT